MKKCYENQQTLTFVQIVFKTNKLGKLIHLAYDVERLVRTSLSLAVTLYEHSLARQDAFTTQIIYMPNRVRRALSCAAGICP